MTYKNNWICECDLIVIERRVCPQCGRRRGKKSGVRYELHGETKYLSDWCDLYQIKVTCVRERIKRGWPFELALVAPKFWSPKTNREF